MPRNNRVLIKGNRFEMKLSDAENARLLDIAESLGKSKSALMCGMLKYFWNNIWNPPGEAETKQAEAYHSFIKKVVEKNEVDIILSIEIKKIFDLMYKDGKPIEEIEEKLIRDFKFII